MTQEEKQLLLKDICARLQSSLICKVIHKDSEGLKEDDMVLRSIEDDEGYFINENGSAYSCDFKPYLRPMSSITEEENKTIANISNKGKGFEEDEDGWIRCDSIHTKWGVWPDGCAKLLDYLNSIHVDYRGLIPMGLAIEAPEGMYNK